MPFAARISDPAAHGGMILGPGVPTVMIGGMIASVVGDNVMCPLIMPPPTAAPHSPAVIIGPGSPTVFIGGMPAARMGDQTLCAVPIPGTVIMGCPTVIIGP